MRIHDGRGRVLPPQSSRSRLRLAVGRQPRGNRRRSHPQEDCQALKPRKHCEQTTPARIEFDTKMPVKMEERGNFLCEYSRSGPTRGRKPRPERAGFGGLWPFCLPRFTPLLAPRPVQPHGAPRDMALDDGQAFWAGDWGRCVLEVRRSREQRCCSRSGRGSVVMKGGCCEVIPSYE